MLSGLSFRIDCINKELKKASSSEIYIFFCLFIKISFIMQHFHKKANYLFKDFNQYLLQFYHLFFHYNNSIAQYNAIQTVFCFSFFILFLINQPWHVNHHLYAEVMCNWCCCKWHACLTIINDAYQATIHVFIKRENEAEILPLS